MYVTDCQNQANNKNIQNKTKVKLKVESEVNNGFLAAWYEIPVFIIKHLLAASYTFRRFVESEIDECDVQVQLLV